MDHVLSVGLLAVLHETVCEEVEGGVKGGRDAVDGESPGRGERGGGGGGVGGECRGAGGGGGQVPDGGEARGGSGVLPRGRGGEPADCSEGAHRHRGELGESLEGGELGEAATKESRRRTEKKHLK